MVASIETEQSQSMRQMNSGVSGHAPKIFDIANPGAQDTQRRETSEQHFMVLTKLPRSAVALYSSQRFVEVTCRGYVRYVDPTCLRLAR